MPIQGEERTLEKPAAKVRPILKPSSTGNWNFVPMEQRKWIDIVVQRSKDPYCFRISKLITQLLRHKEVGREEVGVPCDRTVEEMQGGSVRGLKIFARRSKTKIKHGSALVSGEVERRSVQRWRTEEKVSILFETKVIQKNSCTFEPLKVIQEKLLLLCIARQCNVTPKDFTKYVYHGGNGKELRSIVRNGLVPRGFSTKTGRYAVFFTVVDPMDDEEGLRETFCVLSKARIAPGKHFKTKYIGAICCLLKKEGPTRSSSTTHCLQSSLRKRHA